MKKIIIATNNLNKVKEFKELLKDVDVELFSLKDIGFEGDILETGETFFDNAMIKAKTIFDLYHIPVLADDSGLCVEALNGDPGVFSARFHKDHDSKSNNEYLLELLENEKNRKAKFVCDLIYYYDDNKYESFVGIVEGYIAYKESGNRGFGYDPLFYLEEYKMTMAEISDDEKNKCSHRALASIKFKEYYENLNF